MWRPATVLIAAPLGLMLIAACALQTPTLTRRAVGCYRVQVTGWDAAAADVTGFPEPPAIIALTSSREIAIGTRRALVPSKWRFQGRYTFGASWANTAGEWYRAGDTAILVRPGGLRFHELANDSIIVRLVGWRGGLTGYLEPVSDGYKGLAHLTPRQLARARDLGLLPIHLKRIPCPPPDSARWAGAP